MALTKKQKAIAAEMLMYVVLDEMMDEGKCEDEEEAEVVEEVLQQINTRVQRYNFVPEGGLTGIVAYVKNNY